MWEGSYFIMPFSALDGVIVFKKIFTNFVGKEKINIFDLISNTVVIMNLNFFCMFTVDLHFMIYELSIHIFAHLYLRICIQDSSYHK